MNSAQVRKIIKKYMVPFFEQHGYKLVKSKNPGYFFENIGNSDLKIVYEFQQKYDGTYEVEVSISRGDEDKWPYVDLTCFLDDPSYPDPTILNGDWYFDTEEELIGALEEQANLFIGKAFNWLKKIEDVDIRRIIFERADERARISRTGTPEEKEKRVQKLRVKLEEWEQRRVKPKLWVD